jgi:ubiquinone/menaquinone biosynthesis C-methylase UbiE
MSFIDLFSENPGLYASARPRYPDALLEFVAAMSPDRETAWDCGTGSGQAAVALARHFRTVWATDPSKAQLDHALACPGVIYSIQPAEKVSFPDSSVAALTVAQALHWFDHARFFAEARRVLKPGGFFCAWGYSWSHADPSIDEVVRETVLEPIRRYWPSQNSLLWDGYRTVDLPFRAVPTPALEILQEWTFLEYVAYLHTWSATRRAIQELGPGFFDDACDRIKRAWGNPEQSREIRMPLSILAGISS